MTCDTLLCWTNILVLTLMNIKESYPGIIKKYTTHGAHIMQKLGGATRFSKTLTLFQTKIYYFLTLYQTA